MNNFFQISGLVLLLIACQKPKQNFVFILVDDLGYTDVGYNGSTFYETPNLDAFSKASLNFTNAYSSGSVCSPSRAAIMTGKHPVRLNITDWIPGNDPKNKPLLGPVDLNELPKPELTIAEVLAAEKYKTFFAGKWHLGDEGFFPENQGFQINLGGHHRGSPPGGYYVPYENPKLTDGPNGEYLTDRLTDESIKFLKESKEDPFFLFLSFYTVHTPIQPNLKYVDKFKQKLKSLNDSVLRQKPEGSGITVLNQTDPSYASMVYSMDENVGRILKGLKEQGLYDNTTIIFTSDNGGLSTLDSAYRRLAPTSTIPLRGGKGWLYEGGIRVPLLIKPAGYSKENEVRDIPVIGHDYYPTILTQAGADVGEVDGINLSALFDSPPGRLNSRDLMWHYPHYHGSGWKPGAAIRSGDWKLIHFSETDSVELYKLSTDLSEQTNLSKTHPEKRDELLKKLKAEQEHLGAQFASTNKKLTD